MITPEKAREWLDLLEETPSLLAREAVVEALRTVIAQAEQIERVRALYDRRCAQTIYEVSDTEELFLADLREALDGAS